MQEKKQGSPPPKNYCKIWLSKIGRWDWGEVENHHARKAPCTSQRAERLGTTSGSLPFRYLFLLSCPMGGWRFSQPMASPLPYAASFERTVSFSARIFYPTRGSVQPVPAAPRKGTEECSTAQAMPWWSPMATASWSSLEQPQDAVISSLTLL